MFDLITNYLNNKVNPVLVLKCAVLSSFAAGFFGLYEAVYGSTPTGVAIMLLAFPVGVLTAFEVLYLSHED